MYQSFGVLARIVWLIGEVVELKGIILFESHSLAFRSVVSIFAEGFKSTHQCVVELHFASAPPRKQISRVLAYNSQCLVAVVHAALLARQLHNRVAPEFYVD